MQNIEIAQLYICVCVCPLFPPPTPQSTVSMSPHPSSPIALRPAPTRYPLAPRTEWSHGQPPYTQITVVRHRRSCRLTSPEAFSRSARSRCHTWRRTAQATKLVVNLSSLVMCVFMCVYVMLGGGCRGDGNSVLYFDHISVF